MLSPDSVPAGTHSRPDAVTRNVLLRLAAAMFVIAAATILGALGFEYIGGYLPCHLCLLQRVPYYAGMPVVALAIVAIWAKAPRMVLAALFAIFAVLMIYNAGLAAYHSGVEWGWWEGPASCAPSISIKSAADMLDQLENAHAPSCTEAALRILGLSLAGWNVLISAVLAALGIVATLKAWRAA